MIGLLIGIVLGVFGFKLGMDEDWGLIGSLIFALILVGLGFFLGIWGAMAGAVLLGTAWKAFA